jgi:hypothetical protein
VCRWHSWYNSTAVCVPHMYCPGLAIHMTMSNTVPSLPTIQPTNNNLAVLWRPVSAVTMQYLPRQVALQTTNI